jgi:tetratricopeptide (TPR) repeat protein
MLWGHTRERARVPAQLSPPQIRNGLEPLFDGSIFKRPPAQHRHNLTALFILTVIILAAYCNSFRTGFAQDSRGVILEDSRLTAVNSQNLQKILEENYWWPKAESGLYRPVTTLSYLLNYSILGNEDNAAGYHWVNLVLHLCNSFLVFLLARLLFEDGRPALATASLWALHPVCTEAVTNIVGRADELAALGVLSALLLYIRSTRVRGWRRGAGLTAMAAIVTLAVFSKENAVIIAALLPLFDLSFRIVRRQGHAIRNAVDHLALYCSRGYVFLIPPLLLFIDRHNSMFQKSRPVLMPFVDNPIGGADFGTGRLTAIKDLGKSLWLLLWPQRLSCDYSFNQIPLVDWHKLIEDWQALAGLSVIVALIAVAAACWRRNRLAFFWIGFAFLTALPTSNLLFPIGSIMAERFLYLPSIGFAACLVIAVRAAATRLRLSSGWILAVIIVFAAGWGIRTFQRNRDWIDDETLWSHALTTGPNSFKPHISLAEVRFQQEGPSQRVLLEAEKAISILDKLPNRLNVATPYASLGLYYLSKGDSLAPRGAGGGVLPSEQSRQWYLKALEVLQRGAAIDREFNAAARRRMAAQSGNSANLATFGVARLYSDLGLVYLRLGSPEDAIASYLYERKITPGSPSPYRSLANVYLKMRNYQAAARALWSAFALGTPSENVASYLMRLYDEYYPQSCATYFHAGHEFLNTECALVREQSCGGLEEIAAGYLQAGQGRQTAEVQNTYQQRGCPLGEPHPR